MSYITERTAARLNRAAWQQGYSVTVAGTRGARWYSVGFWRAPGQWHQVAGFSTAIAVMDYLGVTS